MYALVADIEAYPVFLPWCTNASIHSEDETTVEASLELTHSGFSKSFTTRNAMQPDESIALSLVDGPFRQFAGDWTFTDLGNEGSKVMLDLTFEFNSAMTDLVFGQEFEKICNALIDAFTQRAAEVHG